MFNNPSALKKIPVLMFGVTALCFAGCSGSSETDGTLTDVDSSIILDTNDALGVQLDGKIFSIPSPFQTAELIKNSGAPYNAEILNSPNNTANYSTKFNKALNLGVYGADLGYATMYDNTNEALSYLTSVEQLSNELDMGGAFSKEIMDRFSENMGNQDSMLVIVSDAYRNGDEYLKNNDRSQEAGLVLTGGWIEALYFAVEVAAQNKNQNVINRIGEQKSTLGNLIELLEQYSNEESYANLLSEMEELYHAFDNVEFTYSFEKPVTDKDKQLTIIKSSTKVTLSDDDLKIISEKVKSIRTKIVESAL